MEAPAGRIVGDPQPLGDIRQAPTAPTAFEPEPAPIESTSHRDMEAGTGEPTGRRDPSERNRPLDERVPRSMAWRPCPARDIANQLGWKPEPIQVPIVGLGRRGRPYISSFREKTERERDKQNRTCISARVPPQIRTGGWQFRTGWRILIDDWLVFECRSGVFGEGRRDCHQVSGNSERTPGGAIR